MSCTSVEDVKRMITEKNKRAKRNKIAAPKPLPSNVTLEDIIKSLPSEVFTLNRFKSYGSLIVTLALLSLSMYMLAVLPWYLWPAGWFLGGASITGLFSIANDCMNSAFTRNKVVNYLVGTLTMLPLGYSFESLKTSLRYERFPSDVSALAKRESSRITNYIVSWAKGKTFWLASIGYWAEQNFNINIFKPEDRLRVRISFMGVYVFAAVFFSAMWYTVGLFGIVKYWLLPWLGYHILVSTTSLLPAIVLKDEKNNAFIVHCDYPKWLEFLCNDITLLIPRNISTAIPHYHLRKAYKALKQQWGEHFLEINFEWDLVSDLMKSASLPSFSPLPHAPLVSSSDKTEKAPARTPTLPYTSKGAFADFRGFLKTLNWLHIGILIPVPIGALWGLFNVPMTLPTFIWTIVYYFMTGIGITAGYHRLFSHRAFKAREPFKFIIMMLGSGAVEGSVRWWCRDHRAHHRYTDTEKDPYNANFGFWYSHMGWMLVKQDPTKIGRSSIEDLNRDPWIRWQHRQYIPIATFMGVIFPTLVAGLGWGDWMGGYFFAGLLRLTMVHHSTFLVNSLAHYIGTTSFADNHTPRDSIITALLTFGEGYHNFHHEFPADYRNAIKFFQYDPTKWLIIALSYIGQTYDLKKFPENEVFKGQIQMRQKLLDRAKKEVDWGLTGEQLPLVSSEVFKQVLNEGYKLVVIDGIVHDVTEFADDHPGGKPILETMIGKDGTKAFSGGVYAHSNGAVNLMSQMRVGRVDRANWDMNDIPIGVVDSETVFEADVKKYL